ncbi:hypothetical protein D3C86_1918710 [compost metagenome]
MGQRINQLGREMKLVGQLLLDPLVIRYILFNADIMGDASRPVFNGRYEHGLHVQIAVLLPVNELAFPIAALADRRPHFPVLLVCRHTGAKCGQSASFHLRS